MNDFIDVLIEMYTISPKRKQLPKREMEDFMRFFVAFTETDDKYIHMRTAGLVYIRQNEKQLYQKSKFRFLLADFNNELGLKTKCMYLSLIHISEPTRPY